MLSLCHCYRHSVHYNLFVKDVLRLRGLENLPKLLRRVEIKPKLLILDLNHWIRLPPSTS